MANRLILVMNKAINDHHSEEEVDSEVEEADRHNRIVRINLDLPTVTTDEIAIDRMAEEMDVASVHKMEDKTTNNTVTTEGQTLTTLLLEATMVQPRCNPIKDMGEQVYLQFSKYQPHLCNKMSNGIFNGAM
jgi:hypothetical protein